MKYLNIIILLFLFSSNVFAQKEFHVFPTDAKVRLGNVDGDGTLQKPWNLQTALNQLPENVNGGDIIWLHKGVYQGRFVSNLKSTIADKFITVAAFKNEKVILNGNITSKKMSVLEVKGRNVIYNGFEVTFLGEYSRKQGDENFQNITGVNHTSGKDCKFINLTIHNIPGVGFGSWKRTGGTTIKDCMIYNNGYQSKNGRGSGVGLYVQNESDKTRMITNNIVFNNYYKGIEVWSASKNATKEYVKNVTLQNNVVFNNGSPSGVFKDNLIVATNDSNGINVAKNITILNNIFYHNTDFLKNQIGGDAASLTLGFNGKAPLENISVMNNIIIGRNNALRFYNAKSMLFQDNIAYCGYVHLHKSVVENIDHWKLNDNTYFTKRNVPFRISKHKDYTLKQWQSEFAFDKASTWNHIKNFDLKGTLDLSKIGSKNKYKVVLFSKEGKDVEVDFSGYNIPKGATYKIVDVENAKKVIKSGIIDITSKILFPMTLSEFEEPLHNTMAQKTLDNFGVYTIEFDVERVSFVDHFFKWTGF